MTHGKHATRVSLGDRWRAMRRRNKVLLIAAILFALAGTAYAIVVALGGFSGTVTRASFDITLVSATGDTCSAVVSGDDVDITWNDVLETEECRVDVEYSAPVTNSSPIQVQQFVAPSGLTAEFLNDDMCMTPIAGVDRVLSPGEGPALWRIVLTVEAGAGNITFDPQLHGLEWVREVDFNSLLCNPSYS